MVWLVACYLGSMGNCLEDKMDKRGVLEHDITSTAGRRVIELLSSDHCTSFDMRNVCLLME